jgi:ADP-ribose pyrophosphatase YjhB (NUDIX family)
MKVLNIVLYELARIYWKIFRPKTLGARLLLVNSNKVLLVKHTYQHKWFLPGGGVKHGEDFKKALQRELIEELHSKIDDLELFGVYQSKIGGKRDTIVIFLSTQKVDVNEFLFKDDEVEKVVMADVNNLPKNTAPGTIKRIREYQTKNYPNTGFW